MQLFYYDRSTLSSMTNAYIYSLAIHEPGTRRLVTRCLNHSDTLCSCPKLHSSWVATPTQYFLKQYHYSASQLLKLSLLSFKWSYRFLASVPEAVATAVTHWQHARAWTSRIKSSLSLTPSLRLGLESLRLSRYQLIWFILFDNNLLVLWELYDPISISWK